LVINPNSNETVTRGGRRSARKRCASIDAIVRLPQPDTPITTTTEGSSIRRRVEAIGDIFSQPSSGFRTIQGRSNDLPHIQTRALRRFNPGIPNHYVSALDQPLVRKLPARAAMKTCVQCHGKLGLGVRSRNLWNGRWWVHARFCSIHCEALYEQERYDATAHRWRTFLARRSPGNPAQSPS
jgi:hypothetical protein